MAKKLIELASEIVQTQASMATMSAAEIASSLREVFRTLQGMQKSEIEGFDLVSAPLNGDSSTDVTGAPGLMPADSIQKDKVICLECGKEARQLTAKHLAVHGMSPREYRLKYGFTMRTPLAAKSLTKSRSKMAKKRGLPENLTRFLETRRRTKADTTTSQSSSAESADRKVVTRRRKNEV